MQDGVMGILSNGLLAVSAATIGDELATFVAVVSSLVVTATTVAVQIYRIWRDRDDDKKDKENKDK